MIIAAFLTNIMDNYIGHIGLLIFLTFWLFGGNIFFMRPTSNYWIKLKRKKGEKILWIALIEMLKK